MCTAPQNFFIPAGGIDTAQGKVSFEEIAQKFAANIKGLVENPKIAPFVLGSIQNPATADRLKTSVSLGNAVLASEYLANPLFPEARTATPLVLTVKSDNQDIFSRELFGPIALLIATKDTKESVALAKAMATEHGAISCGAYTTNADVKEFIMDEMAEACTPVSFNLTGGIYLNQHATFSDFHVTGGNPAGNASFTNPEYVVKRFTWVGFREPVTA
jgi:acyl-CoA reductase-like NAD-dependent aldehyde dehydrogenase